MRKGYNGVCRAQTGQRTDVAPVKAEGPYALAALKIPGGEPVVGFDQRLVVPVSGVRLPEPFIGHRNFFVFGRRLRPMVAGC